MGSNINNHLYFIGIVRFYDSIKQFGFIDTNMFGKSNSVITCGGRHLYFRKKDFRENEVLNAGDWVTFRIFETPEGKNDNARYIRKVSTLKNDFALAMQYTSPYSTIVNENWRHLYDVSSYDIKKSIMEIFIQTTNGKQIVFDYVIDTLASENANEELKHLFANGVCFELLINPTGHGIIVADYEKYEYALSGAALIKIDEFQHRTTKIGDGDGVDIISDFMQCVEIATEIALRDLGIKLSIMLASDPNDTRLFLRRLPNNTIRRLLVNHCVNAETRLYLFSVLKDPKFLYDNSVVEYLNKGMLLATPELNKLSWPLIDSKLFHGFMDRCSLLQFKDEIIPYILSTNTATDSLLFVLFTWSSDYICFEKIRNKEAMLIDIAQNDSILYDFLSLAEYIPSDVIAKTIDIIGLNKLFTLLHNNPKSLASICFALNDYDVTDILVVTKIMSEEQRFEQSDWYGGYWNWDEGMKHQKYDVTTYSDRVYSYKIYVRDDAPQNTISFIHSVLNDIKQCISDGIQSSVSRTAHLLMGTKILRISYVHNETCDVIYNMNECHRIDNVKISVITDFETVVDD